MDATGAFLRHINPQHIASWNASHNTIYAVSRDRTVVFFNDAWERFSELNGGASAPRLGLGVNVVEVIAPPLRGFYAGLYDRGFEGEKLSHEYLCGSATSMRRYRMTLFPFQSEAYVLVDHALIVSREREPSTEQFRLEEYQDRNLILQCAHCRCTRRRPPSQQWDFIPEFVQGTPPGLRVSHGLCPPCEGYYFPFDA